MTELYDYIIVGAGSAGCVLAERLSADRKTRVLLLEAGGSDRRFWVKLPIGYGRTFYDERINWKFETEPDPATHNRRGYWPRGKLLGGSSSINAMVWCRGLPGDFDDWRALGNDGWGAEEVRATYERIERRVEADGKACSEGPLTITDPRHGYHPLKRHFLAAGEELGLPYSDDFNGEQPEGVGFYRISTRHGMRCSAADAFLRPAMARPNLHVHTHAHTHRVLFEGRRAVGVRYRQDVRIEEVRARRDVILSAGAVCTPMLLQRSGVGPGAVLRSHGIEVVLDQPAVGGGLQDHLSINYFYKSTEPTLNDVLTPLRGKVGAALRYALTLSGPLSLSVNQCGGFVRSRGHLPRADLQLYFSPITYTTSPADKRPLITPDPFSGFITCFQPCRPASRGRIDIRSPDPQAPPRITPNYLAHADDIEVVLAGARLMQAMARTRALRSIIAEEIPPGLERMDDEQMVEDFRARSATVFHPVGTCAMGPDARTAVVEPHGLRVHGLQGLRVVDASAFPTITSGNTNAPTIMLAWKAADAILAGDDTG